MEPVRKYAFTWGLLGNIEIGRPNLGAMTRLEVYRLMQFCFRGILERKYGTAEADLYRSASLRSRKSTAGVRATGPAASPLRP